MELINNNKNKTIVRVLRIIMMLTFVYKGFLFADGTYNSNTSNGLGAASSTMYAGLLIGVALSTALLGWLTTYFSFTIFSRSKYAPTRADGVVDMSYCTYHANAYISIIIANLVIGSISLIAFYNNILSALIICVISKLVIVAMIVLFDVLIGRKFKGADGKRFMTAVAIPNILMLVLL